MGMVHLNRLASPRQIQFFCKRFGARSLFLYGSFSVENIEKIITDIKLRLHMFIEKILVVFSIWIYGMYIHY